MIDRLRFLLDRPLDPLAARAVLVLATAVLLGFAAVLVLSSSGSDRVAVTRAQVVSTRSQASQPLGRTLAKTAPLPRPAPHRRSQDPQDEKDSPAGQRAAKTLRSHSALQHVPYRSGELMVVLVGTRGDRAELRVSASSTRVAREGWRQFLRRYRDSGRAYVPLFKSTGGGSDG